MEDFEDLVEANEAYAARFDRPDLPGRAARGLAVVTCMDSRIDPAAALGLQPGDAKVLRNPGGRVNHDTLEALVVAVHLLGVERIIVMPHTRCAMASMTDEQLHERLVESSGSDTVELTAVRVTRDQLDSLADDVQKVRTHPLVPDSVVVGGFVYDVDTARVDRRY